MKRLITVAAMALLAGCYGDRMSEQGFSLPDGDPIAGREAFLYMHCHECHFIEGLELPPVPLADPPFIELGGKVTKVKTYGELVTAIINPSHKLAKGYRPEDITGEGGQSIMPIYNGFMTVQELIDIVMFLQPHYEVYVPRYEYRIYN